MGKFLRELFLVAPDFQFERAVHCFKPAHKRCGAPPSAFFVETRCAVVADGTGKPPGLDAGRGKLFLRIRDQRRSNAGAPHFGRYIKLIELVTLQQREALRRTSWTRSANTGERGFDTPNKIVKRPSPDQGFGKDRGMRLVPTAVPQACKLERFFEHDRADFDHGFLGCTGCQN